MLDDQPARLEAAPDRREFARERRRLRAKCLRCGERGVEFTLKRRLRRLTKRRTAGEERVELRLLSEQTHACNA
jgi:hypothetical protein